MTHNGNTSSSANPSSTVVSGGNVEERLMVCWGRKMQILFCACARNFYFIPKLMLKKLFQGRLCLRAESFVARQFSRQAKAWLRHWLSLICVAHHTRCHGASPERVTIPRFQGLSLHKKIQLNFFPSSVHLKSLKIIFLMLLLFCFKNLNNFFVPQEKTAKMFLISKDPQKEFLGKASRK